MVGRRTGSTVWRKVARQGLTFIEITKSSHLKCEGLFFGINFRKFEIYIEIQNESAILFCENRKKVSLWSHLYLLVNGSANGLL